jgi:hypothetical protein
MRRAIRSGQCHAGGSQRSAVGPSNLHAQIDTTCRPWNHDATFKYGRRIFDRTELFTHMQNPQGARRGREFDPKLNVVGRRLRIRGRGDARGTVRRLGPPMRQPPYRHACEDEDRDRAKRTKEWRTSHVKKMGCQRCARVI